MWTETNQPTTYFGSVRIVKNLLWHYEVFCKDGADTYQSFGSYREGKIGLFRIAGVKDGLIQRLPPAHASITAFI